MPSRLLISRFRRRRDHGHAWPPRNTIRIFIVLFILGFPAWAAGAGQSEASPARPVILALESLSEPTDTLSLKQGHTLDREGRFLPQPGLRLHVTDNAVHWLRLRIAIPPGTDATAWVIDCNWNFLRLLNWYFPDSPDIPPRQNGDGNFHLPSTCPLPAGASGELTVSIQAAGYGGFNINPVIRSQEEIQAFTTMRPWLLGLFAGVMAAMLVYNLFLFLSLHDWSYFFYVLNATLLLLYYAFSTGVIFELMANFSVQSPSVGIRSFEIVAAALFLNMGLFTRSFLLTQRQSPVIDKILLGQITLSGILLVACALLPPHTAIRFGPPVGVITAAAIILATVTRLIQGFKPAGIFLAGWVFYVLCGAVHSLTWLGIVAATPLTFHAPMFGTVVEVLVMSLALAYRVKLLREQTALSEQERERLSRENILLSMILDDRRFGIGVVRDGRFHFANRQLSRHLGREHLTGTALAEVPYAVRLLGQAPAPDAGQTDTARELVVNDNSGGRSLRAMGRLLTPDTPREGTVWIVEDTSECNRLEKLRNDVDQIMRHDLKSPLATIASLQEALELAGPLTQRQKDLAVLIERNIAAMTSRINLSLYLYKMEAGTLSLTLRPLALPPLLEEVRQDLHPLLTAGQTSLEITFTAPPGEFVILGERLLLWSLCVNLLQNALEAAQGLGPVTVLVENPQAPRLVITNPGETPPEIRDRFFEKYVTAGKKKGTGLGTYSARLIARNLGGDIQLDTSRPGYTTVVVSGLKPA